VKLLLLLLGKREVLWKDLNEFLNRNPFEVMKQQMQIGLNSTMKETFQHILKTSGVRGSF